jgi:hypothetical protein
MTIELLLARVAALEQQYPMQQCLLPNNFQYSSFGKHFVVCQTLARGCGDLPFLPNVQAPLARSGEQTVAWYAPLARCCAAAAVCRCLERQCMPWHGRIMLDQRQLFGNVVMLLQLICTDVHSSFWDHSEC